MLKVLAVASLAAFASATMIAAPAEARTVIIKKKGMMGSKTVIKKSGPMRMRKEVVIRRRAM